MQTLKDFQTEKDIETRNSILIMFKSEDDISIPLIQRKCQAGYYSATRTFENLVKEGLIKRGKGHGISKFI